MGCVSEGWPELVLLRMPGRLVPEVPPGSGDAGPCVGKERVLARLVLLLPPLPPPASEGTAWVQVQAESYQLGHYPPDSSSGQ